jgi:GTPase SAR1 family protein
VGKTTLGKSLERGAVASLFTVKKERADENISERTRGVAVRPISIPGHKDADFSLWDYAGQEEVRKAVSDRVVFWSLGYAIVDR